MLRLMRQRDTTAGELARVLAGWLIAVLLMQGFAAVQTLVRGAPHRHAEGVAGLWAGAAFAVGSATDDSHARAHAVGTAHHHGADRVVLPADAEAALDAAACVLMGVLAPWAVSYAWGLQPAAAAFTPGAVWALAECVPAPPRRPPRA